MSMLAPLRHAAFRYLVAGRFVNMLGNAVAPIALAFAVLDLTGSVRDLGLVVGARSLMNVVFVLFGGVLAAASFWTWRTVAKLIDGTPLTEPRELELFKACSDVHPVAKHIAILFNNDVADVDTDAHVEWL